MKEKKIVAMNSYGYTRVNLFLLLISVLLLIVGYVLLSGGSSGDGVSFDPEVFNARRTSVAPIILTLGYAGVLVAILWRKKESGKSNKEVQR